MKDVIINTAFALGVCSILVLLAMAIVASFIEEGKRGPDAVHNQIMMVGQDNSRVDLYVDRLTGCPWRSFLCCSTERYGKSTVFPISTSSLHHRNNQ